MASRYALAVYNATDLANLAPNVPGANAAGISGSAAFAWQEDIAQLVVRNNAGTAQRIPTAATSVQTIRRRCTIAEVNAGVTLLAAVAGRKYQMVDCQAIAIGGAAAAVTTVDILATQSAASVKLAAFAQASLTQSTVLRPGIAGTAVLADGASFVPNDVNTAITIGKTGSNVTTATHIDITFSYTLQE